MSSTKKATEIRSAIEGGLFDETPQTSPVSKQKRVYTGKTFAEATHALKQNPGTAKAAKRKSTFVKGTHTTASTRVKADRALAKKRRGDQRSKRG